MAQKALSKAVFEEYHLLPSGNKCLHAFLSLDWILTIYWTLLYIQDINSQDFLYSLTPVWDFNSTHQS